MGSQFPPAWAQVMDMPVVRNPLPNPHFQRLLSFPGAFPAPLNRGPQGARAETKVHPCRHLGHGGQGSRGSEDLGGARDTSSHPSPAQPQREFLLCPETFRKQLEGSCTPLSPQRWIPEPLPLFLALKVLHGPWASYCPPSCPPWTTPTRPRGPNRHPILCL